MDSTETFNVIIAGGRHFLDYKSLVVYCDKILRNKNDVTIISGTANGTDKLGERYAKARGYKIKKFPADWKGLKLAAGYIRNKQMAKYSDALIAFWDTKSKGTRHMIDLAHENGLLVRVYNY